jgi:hypothetical protein
MEELKKVSYEAGVTTHTDVRNAINDNIDKETKNFGILEKIPYVIAKGDTITGFSKESAKAKMEELGVKALYHIQGTCDSEGILNKDGIIPELIMVKWYYDENGDVVSESNNYGTRVAIWDIESDFSSAISQYVRMYTGSLVFLAMNVRFAPVVKIGSMNSEDSEGKKMVGIGTFTWDSDGNGVLRLATGTKTIKKEYTVDGATNSLQLKSITPKKSGYDVIDDITDEEYKALKDSIKTAQVTGTDAKNLANTAQQTANEVARIQALTPSGTIPFDTVHEDGLTLESLDYDLEPVDLDADVVLGVTVELYPSATTGDKMRAKGVFVANLTLKGTPSSRRALNWKASAKYGVQDSRQYNNATRTGDATGYITDENFGQNGGIVHGNLFWCKADKKVYHYTTSTTNNYGVFVEPDAGQALKDAEEAKNLSKKTPYYINVKDILQEGGSIYDTDKVKSKLQELGVDSIFSIKGAYSESVIVGSNTMQKEIIITRYYLNEDGEVKSEQIAFGTRVRLTDIESDFTGPISDYVKQLVFNDLVPFAIDRCAPVYVTTKDGVAGIGSFTWDSKGTGVLKISSIGKDYIKYYDTKEVTLKLTSITPRSTGWDVIVDSAEDFMKSMFLQFDEVQSPIEMASDNSMGYDIADPDAADSGITKANIILAQTVTYNGGTRAKGTFVAQFTTSSGTKYALNWKHSSKLGLADSRYYNNAGANPFTSGTETDPTKYISDDATFKSTEFRGIRGENTYLCKGTGAVYVRDTQSTEWYKIVIDPSKWVETN